MKYTNIPPYAPTLMESTRAIGYSIEAAIADIIDNSIAAKAGNVDIDFFPLGDTYISILDDGCGMSEDKLIAAMQYGSTSPLEKREAYDLGRYGLGMKTASLSQSRILTVISKYNEKISGAQWNLNYIKEAKDWSLIILEGNEFKSYPSFEKLSKLKSGTLVIWQDLDKFAVGECSVQDAFTKKMSLIRDHVSLVFHRYLSGEVNFKKLNIRMNGISINPKDPFLIGQSTQLMDAENIIVREDKVVVKPFILPHVSKLTSEQLKELGGKEGLRKGQGFYVYRNKRLLVWGTWFRLMRQGDLSKLARVQVDIPNSLDDLWTLDIKKSVATPPEEVRKNLALIVNKITEGSKKTWTFRGKKELSKDVTHVWNRLVARDGGIFYEINMDYPLILNLFKEYPKIETELRNIFKQIGLSLPLNSLYIDLTNDEKIENDIEVPSEDIIKLLKGLVGSKNDLNERYAMIEMLKLAEPFSSYRNEIDDAKEKGAFDE